MGIHYLEPKDGVRDPLDPYGIDPEQSGGAALDIDYTVKGPDGRTNIERARHARLMAAKDKKKKAAAAEKLKKNENMVNEYGRRRKSGLWWVDAREEEKSMDEQFIPGLGLMPPKARRKVRRALSDGDSNSSARLNPLDLIDALKFKPYKGNVDRGYYERERARRAGANAAAAHEERRKQLTRHQRRYTAGPEARMRGQLAHEFGAGGHGQITGMTGGYSPAEPMQTFGASAAKTKRPKRKKRKPSRRALRDIPTSLEDAVGPEQRVFDGDPLLGAPDALRRKLGKPVRPRKSPYDLPDVPNRQRPQTDIQEHGLYEIIDLYEEDLKKKAITLTEEDLHNSKELLNEALPLWLAALIAGGRQAASVGARAIGTGARTAGRWARKNPKAAIDRFGDVVDAAAGWEPAGITVPADMSLDNDPVVQRDRARRAAYDKKYYAQWPLHSTHSPAARYGLSMDRETGELYATPPPGVKSWRFKGDRRSKAEKLTGQTVLPMRMNPHTPQARGVSGLPSDIASHLKDNIPTMTYADPYVQAGITQRDLDAKELADIAAGRQRQTSLIESTIDLNEADFLKEEPLEIKLLEKVIYGEMTAEEAKEQLPEEMHQAFDYFLQKSMELRQQEDEPEEVPGLEESIYHINEVDLFEQDLLDVAGIFNPIASVAGDLRTIQNLKKHTKGAKEKGEKFSKPKTSISHEAGSINPELARTMAGIRADVDNLFARRGGIKPIWDAPQDREEFEAQQKRQTKGDELVKRLSGGDTERAMERHGTKTGQKRSPFQPISAASKYRR